MSANNSKPKPVAPVVVLREEKSEMGRYLLRLLPAGLASLFFHGLLLGSAIVYFVFIGSSNATETLEAQRVDNINAEQPIDEKKETFSVTDVDLSATEFDTNINYQADRIGEVSVPGTVNPSETAGILDGDKTAPPVNIPAPGGFGKGQGGALDAFDGKGNSQAIGEIGGYNPRGVPLQGSFYGRSGQTREFAWRNGGGTTESEAAVARGLKWIARQQLPDGRWQLDSPNLAAQDRGGEKNDVAGTALGLLPLLAAGKTHKPSDKNEYDKIIDKGLKFLMKRQNAKTGYFGVSMYAHGLATITMCEAYGLSQDPALRKSAQGGINLLVATQHEGGGWRYSPSKVQGDLSVTGWQIMALKSGQMAGLDVPTVTVRKAVNFLNFSCNPADEGYGYNGPGSAPTMTAVGLLCRQYMENWGPSHPRLIKAIGGILKANSPEVQKTNVYYYYYATQVMHHFGGESWKNWNEKMREQLISKQEKNQSSANFGSWPIPPGDNWSRAGGRLMVTSLNLLTLEVYYRYLPLYYRDAGYKMDEAAKKAL